MKKVWVVPFVGLILVGCSSKERLKGERKNVILSNVLNDKIEIDKSPVIVDAPQKNSDFTQVCYSHDHCYQPLQFSANPQLLWTANLDFESSRSLQMLAPAIVADNKVFCADAAGVIYAFDCKTGEQIWRKSTTLKGKDGQIGVSMAYKNGQLIVSTSFAEAMAINSKSGDVVWRIKLPAPCKGDGITIADRKAYFLCDNGSLQVINAQLGNFLWSHSGMTGDTTFSGSASVAIKDGVVYMASPSGEVCALAENGSVIWSAMMSKFSFVDAAESFSHPRACPLVKDNIVYFTGANQQTTAFDIRTGTVVWKKDVGSVQTPVVSGNSIFIYDSDSGLVCLNKDNGKRRWVSLLNPKTTNESDESVEWFGPVLTDKGLIMVSSKGNLVCVSVENGKVLHRLQLDDSGDGINVRPVIANGAMYIPMNCGKLVAYR